MGGFHTEYSSLKFALFFLAEYINMTTVAALATTMFLGGWRAPWPISVWAGANTGWWPLLWFLAKLLILLFCFIWLRGTLPRIRYDQLMRFGWKVLIPVSLAWILMIATIRVWRPARWQHAGLHRRRGHLRRPAGAGLGRRRGRRSGGGAAAAARCRAAPRRSPRGRRPPASPSLPWICPTTTASGVTATGTLRRSRALASRCRRRATGTVKEVTGA